MTRTLSHLIQDLYQISITPLTVSVNNEQALLDSISFVQKRITSVAHFNIAINETVNSHHIEDIILFALNLVHTKRSRSHNKKRQHAPEIKGILRINDCIRHLVKSSLTEANASEPEKNTVLTILTEWFNSLHAALPQDYHIYNSIPDLEDPPFISLQYYMYQYSKTDNNDTRSLYFSYAYPLYKALRFFEVQHMALGTFYDYLRSIRYFYQFVPSHIKGLSTHPDAMPVKYIREAFDEYQIINPRSAMGPEYHRRFMTIIIDKAIHCRSFTDRNIESKDNLLPSDGHVHLINSENGNIDLPDNLSYEDLEIDQADINDGYEFAYLSGFVRIDAEQTVVPTKPTLKKGWENFIHLRSFHFHWDSSYLNLFHYAIFYRFTASFWGTSSFDNAYISFLFILFHTGLDFEKLINLRCKIDDNISADPVLIRFDTRYYISLPSLLKFKQSKTYDNFCRVSNRIYVPLPSLIGNMIDQLPLNDYVFSFISDGIENRLTLKTLEMILINLFNSKSAFHNGVPLNISLTKIASSFLPMYCNRFGLDPILCVYISGKDYHRLYQSAMHYIQVPHEHLENSYLEAFDRVHKAINDNLESCISNGYLSELHNTFRWLSVPYQFSSKLPDVTYGSAKIATIEYLRSYIHALRSAIAGVQDPILGHNLFAIYIYIGLQFSEALRPRNCPGNSWHSINFIAQSIAVCDKESRNFHEQRILAVPNVILSLVSRLRTGISRLQIYVCQRYNPRFLKYNPDNLFYFVSDNGESVDFTLPRMREYLASVGLDTDTPSNMPRHFTRSYVFRQGVHNSMGSALMGHSHAGQEPLNITSSTITSVVSDGLLPIIDQMLIEIGYIDVNYPIGG